MSTRIYRLWQSGNPQTRVFLPDFWMKLLRPKYPCPPNHVLFAIHPEMTEHDVKEYLTKIYNVPVRGVRLTVREGAVKMDKTVQERVRLDDEKLAYVTLKDVNFTFPDLYPDEKRPESRVKKADEKITKPVREAEAKVKREEWHREGVPTWFP